MKVSKISLKINVFLITTMLLASFSFIQFSHGTPMPLEERQAILLAIGKGLRDRYMFIDGDPEMHDTNNTAAAWLRLAQCNMFRNNPQNRFDITSREGFEAAVNGYLRSQVCSHLFMVKASAILAQEFAKRLKEVGISYERCAGPSLQYKVTHVDPAGAAYKDGGIRVNTIFSLPNHKIAQGTFAKILDNIRYGRWSLTFNTGKRKHLFFLKNKSIGSQATYEPNDEYEQRIRELGKEVILPVEIKSFDSNYSKGYIAGALQYAAQNLDHIVIDLRDNMGGKDNKLMHFLSYFLEPQTTCFVRVGRKIWEEFRGTEEYQKAIEVCKESCGQLNNEFGRTLLNYIDAHQSNLCYKITENNPKFNGKVAIFINNKTGSAAELAAGILRELLGPNRCVLIGKRTGRQVLGSGFRASEIIGEYYIQYPAADALLPSGTRIEGKGVAPDIKAISTEECLEAARKWFDDPEAFTPRNGLNNGLYRPTGLSKFFKQMKQLQK